MLTAIIVVSVALVIAALLGAVAYGGPKTYWYWGQINLLTKSQQASDKLMDIHIADHTTDVDEIDVSKALTPDKLGQYL